MRRTRTKDRRRVEQGPTVGWGGALDNANNADSGSAAGKRGSDPGGSTARVDLIGRCTRRYQWLREKTLRLSY